jgi:outer membrane protein TolC
MKRLTLVLAAGLLASGCSVTPKPLTMEELRNKSSARLAQYTVSQEEITRPIGLYEAMARAIKYNLDYKVELYEEALRSSELNLSSMNMLPELVLSAGISDRENYSGSRSSALLGSNSVGDVSLVPSTSSDKDLVTSDLELSWDVLDFGLSYVRAKQKADAALIANERKRKVANRIIEDVRTAYWRAVSAEQLIGKLNSLESDIAQALTDADESYRQRKTSPLAALTYQRELLDIQSEIQTMHNELFVAKRQLAALMNLSPTTKFTVVQPTRDVKVAVFNLDPNKLVSAAMVNRPELRELNYEQRISENEANSALLQLLPNLRLFGGFNYNSNEFLFNNNWAAWGAQASWNIFDVFRYPAHKRTNALEQELLKQRSLALTMAVVTQVHVSASRYQIASRKLETMRKYYDVTGNILDQIESGYKARKVSYQNFVREKMNSLVAEAQYDVAQADLQNAYANIFAAVGQDTFGRINTAESSVAELAEHLQSHWGKISRQLMMQN